MNRRNFLRTTAAGLALSSLRSFAADFADMKKRVGLIGCGWYGKTDLFRLIQVAPIDVVSLCDGEPSGGATTLVSEAAARIHASVRAITYTSALGNHELREILGPLSKTSHPVEMIGGTAQHCSNATAFMGFTVPAPRCPWCRLPGWN